MNIWDDADAIRAAVAISTSRRMVITNLGFTVSQSVYRRLERHCLRHGIVLDFANPYGSQQRWPNDVVFVENSPFVNNRVDLKARYLAMGYANLCTACGIGPQWNGQALTLQLDHINGINNDHRLSNLRIMCPNCHTQTPTYAGRRRCVSLAHSDEPLSAGRVA